MGYKRKIFIVDKKLQYRIIGMAAASGVTISFLSVIGLSFLSNQIIRLMEVSDVSHELSMTILSEMDKFSLYIIGLTIVSLLIAWTAALYLSNRIAGPVFQIKRVLDQYIEGDKNVRIHIRKDDFFTELVEKINKVLDEKK